MARLGVETRLARRPFGAFQMTPQFNSLPTQAQTSWMNRHLGVANLWLVGQIPFTNESGSGEVKA
jgi:hypothetical protein